VRVALVGIGAVGARAARHLLADPDVESLLLVHRDADGVSAIVDSFVPLNPDSPPGAGPRVEIRTGLASAVPDDVDVVVLTQPDRVREAAEIALVRGANVVSTADDPAEVRRLLGLDYEARRLGRTVAVGAAMAPGLSCVLATFGAQALDAVNQVHVSSLGTGGPACARRHHAALSSAATDWLNGEWHRRPGGSGRELVWFPEPAGGADCYRAELIDPVLLVPAFPTAQKVTARLAATRRDRLTSFLPMMRRPHPEGRIGAVRVELRGWRGGVAEVCVLGATSRPAVIAGAVASLAATWAGAGRMARSGAGGLAVLVGEPGTFLRELHTRGVRTVQFEGSEPVVSEPDVRA
jgi:saccharopine dehydrogenase-like NADP-dependent oxidoreductase